MENADTFGRWEVLETAGAYWLNVRTTGQLRAGGFFGGCADDRSWRYVDSTRTVPVGALGILEAFWDGRLGDVRIYRRALSAAAVADLAP